MTTPMPFSGLSASFECDFEGSLAFVEALLSLSSGDSCSITFGSFLFESSGGNQSVTLRGSVEPVLCLWAVKNFVVDLVRIAANWIPCSSNYMYSESVRIVPGKSPE